MGDARLFGGERGLEGGAKSSEMASSNRGKVSKRFAEALLLLSTPVGKKCAGPRISVSDVSGRDKDIGVAKKSSRSVVRSVKAEARDWSTGGRRFGKRFEEAPDVVGLGDGWIMPGEGGASGFEMVELGVNQPFSGCTT